MKTEMTHRQLDRTVPASGLMSGELLEIYQGTAQELLVDPDLLPSLEQLGMYGMSGCGSKCGEITKSSIA